MGWIKSPPYFSTGSETGLDVVTQYIEAPIGSLLDHKFWHLTKVNYNFQDVTIVP